MWQGKAVKRHLEENNPEIRKSEQQRPSNANKERWNQVISYQTDWAAEWPQNGNPNETNYRLRVEDDKEWQIWNLNNRKRAHSDE